MQATDLARIADIIPPETPLPLTSPIDVAVLVLSLLLLAWFLLFYRRSLHARLLRLRLRQRYCANRKVAMQLRSLIRYQLPHDHVFADNLLNTQWQAFCSQLQHACFAREQPDDALLHDLFKHSRFWLKQLS